MFTLYATIGCPTATDELVLLASLLSYIGNGPMI